jgi:hypothetical protein
MIRQVTSSNLRILGTLKAGYFGSQMRDEQGGGLDLKEVSAWVW